MVRRISAVVFLSILAVSLSPMAAPASAQVTVQLPTFRVTGVQTTVLVPDRGSVYLGGVTDASIYGSSYGSPFGGSLPGLRRNLGNRTFGRSVATSDFWVSATIIDHAELDRAVLAEAERRQQLRRQPTVAAELSQPRLQPRPQLRGAASHPATEADRVDVYLDRARRAEADGQPQIAKIFYQRIAKHGTASQQRLAEARLAALESKSKR